MKLPHLIISLFLATPLGIFAQKNAETPPKKAFADNKTQAIKITPLAFGLGYTTIAYEKSLKKGRSIECRLGLVGAGVPPPPSVGVIGATGTFGYKFIYQSTEPPKRNKYQHVLRGWYFRPELTIAAYQEQYESLTYTPNVAQPTLQKERLFVAYGTVMATAGYQKVRRWGLVSDFFAGAGLAVVNPINGNGLYNNGRYGNFIPFDKSKNNKTGMSYSLKLGFLIGGVF